MGVALQDQGKREEAVEAYDKALFNDYAEASATSPSAIKAYTKAFP